MNAMNITKHPFLSAVAGLALVVSTGASVAADRQGESLPAITLKYDAVEAATPAGAEKLYKQIKQAAANVCERYESQELVRRMPWQKCQAQVIANAVAAVHQPELTALHDRSTVEPRG